MLAEQRFRCVERVFSDLKPRPQIGHSGKRGRGLGRGGTRCCEVLLSRSSRHLNPSKREQTSNAVFIVTPTHGSGDVQFVTG